MKFHITPDMMAAAYDYFRASRPFRRWKLPESDSVIFKVTREPKTVGYYNRIQRDKDSHEIGVSEIAIGSTHRLFELMAHEMIHMHQDIQRSGMSSGHNAEFRRFAGLVCRHHIFDPKAFI